MTWKAVVAGVDRSAEGAWAATTAWHIAKAASAPFHLVHAVRDVPVPPTAGGPLADQTEIRQALLAASHAPRYWPGSLAMICN